MKRTCKFCKKEIECETFQHLGGHVAHCEKNPNKYDNYRHMKELGTQKSKKSHKLYKFECLKCGKKYELNLTKNQFDSGDYKKFCCYNCSSKYSNSFVDYNKTKTAKCIDCGKTIQIKLTVSLKKCRCDDCNNRKVLKIKKGLTKTREISNGKIFCKMCGSEKCKNDICKGWNSGRSKTLIKLGFDITKFGSNLFYEEYDRISNMLKLEYENNSLIEIGEKYNINVKTILNTIRKFDITCRSMGESQRLSLKKKEEGRYQKQ